MTLLALFCNSEYDFIHQSSKKKKEEEEENFHIWRLEGWCRIKFADYEKCKSSPTSYNFSHTVFKYIVNYQYAVCLELYTNPNPIVLGLRN